MVSTDLRRSHRFRTATAGGRALLAGALTALAACRSGARAGSADADSTALGRVVAQVQASYTSADLVAAGAFTWTSPRGVFWVLIDVQSAVEGLVQARADLWAGDDSGVVRMGQSDVFPSAAEVGAYAFEDVTGDGMPDLLGFVMDSAGVSYPVFLTGARGTMSDAVEVAARGWHLSTDEEQAPRLYGGNSGVCAIQAWAEEPAPDRAPAGWRYLVIGPEGRLSEPVVSPPVCQ